jgi:thioredoxin-related protein
MRWVIFLAALLPFPALSQDVPEWFIETFLDIREDAAEAAKDGKRLMLYFTQEGCPYCKQLVTVNFRDAAIIEKTRRHFMPVAINIWGDREVTMADGRKLPEKKFAAALKVQFTPTLVFFDEKGTIVHRINGYLPPEPFYAALDSAIGKAPVPSPLPAGSSVDVRRKAAAKPLAVLLVSPGCDACDELERNLKHADLRSQVGRLELIRASNPTEVVSATGRGKLHSSYVPALVFFSGGREIFRTEAYFRRFHLASVLEYVASGSYVREPSFQRFLQTRADSMRSRGASVELWD